MANPSSPKKRRTDDGTVTADAIAQSNSTIQIFLGQGNRQNRWMQGYVPPSTSTAPAESPAVNGGRKKGASLATAQGSRERHPNAEGATGRTDGRARGSTNVVEYESPATVSTSAVTSHATTTQAENITRSAAQQGLPSPAASDENTASPTLGSTMGSDPGLLRGRPPSMNHGHPAAQNGSPALGVREPGQAPNQQHARSSSASMATPSRFDNLQPPAPVPSNARVQQDSTIPSQPVGPMPQSPFQAEDMLSQMAMLRRFQAFRKETSKFKLNNVDTGRLTLLGEAIERGDLFYIVLSQIHALRTRPDLIPDSAKKLHPKCFQYLDYLICSTDLLTDVVRNWLAKFPAQILKIYFSPAISAIYEPMVRQVTEFLLLLPEHWDSIITESKHRETPPLVEDLFDTLHLPSVVFQTTAFRAIARLVLDQKVFAHSEKGIDRLQVLHKMDQLSFAQNGRRNLEERSLAYRAFRITKHAWKDHEAKLREYERQHPNGHKQKQPPSFMFPPDAFAAFQQRVSNPIPPAPGNTVQHQITSQQQAALLATTSVRSQGPQRSHQFIITPEMRQRSSMIQPQNNVGTPSQVLPAPGFIFPREGELPRAQPTNPDPLRSALHQAHLRSPSLGPVQPQLGAPRLYRHINGFALSPKKIDKDLPIQMFHFEIPRHNFERVPVTIPSQRAGEPPSRSITEISHTYRLRCASYSTDVGFPTESTWVVADNCWPENLFLVFNGAALEPRRKLHHSRYLPIDLTQLTKPGENTIEVIVNRMSTDKKPFEYVIAVEIVGATSHESIRENIRTIDAKKTSEAIQKSLASSDDDDLAVTSSNLTIKLFDPYSSSKIFDIPVRGSACVHKDCFDLETFLSMCKREKPGWPTVVDCWRCPLCRGDVRPQALVIDGFLVNVRKQLAERNLLHTRAIVVKADGTWSPKAEERTGVRSPSLGREEGSVSERGGSVSASKKVVEIIEID